MFGKRREYKQEDVSVEMARKAVCRVDTELTPKGKTKYRPFYFKPSQSDSAGDEYYRIGEDRVVIALLVAPRRCGKTTLLSTMYREFRQVMGNDFCMDPFRMGKDLETKLDNNRKSLTDFTNAPGLNEGLAPSDTLEEYEFIIYSKAHPQLGFMLRFIDVPGEWVNAHQEAMSILISGADILYITINAPALMEENGCYNEEFNASSVIMKLTDSISDERIRERNRLLMFVPVKCEKYYWEVIRGENAEALANLNGRIRECYDRLIKSVQQNEHLKNHTAVAVTPIMTVGGAKFTQFTSDDAGGHKDSYIRIIGYITDSNGYRPTFCEQPLLYTLRFIRTKVMSQVKKGRMGNFFADWRKLGLRTAFRFSFHDPLCEAILQKTEYADFSMFKTVGDFQMTESADAGKPDMKYPEGLYRDVDVLGYSILSNPQGVIDDGV